MRTPASNGASLRLRLLLPGLVSALFTAGPAAADPEALWKIVHDRCVPAAEAGTGTGPCASVDLGRGVAVLKDIRGRTQFLLIPTERVTGIESPAVLGPAGAVYWQAAWEARRFMAERAGSPVPREDVALAVNSALGRSQNQLHIHIDCVAAGVRQWLASHEGEIVTSWAPLTAPLEGQRYRARRVYGETFEANPFALLAQDLEAAPERGEQTLVAIGALFEDHRPGFLLLAGRADPAKGEWGSGENLEDHACAVLR